jgi:hypothetical protein
MAHGSIDFTFYGGYRLEKQLAEVAEGGGRLVRDAFFS